MWSAVSHPSAMQLRKDGTLRFWGGDFYTPVRLEVESRVEEDTAIASSGGTEESAGKGLRFAEERASERAIGRGEVFAVHHVLSEDGEREAVFARHRGIQLSGTPLIAA